MNTLRSERSEVGYRYELGLIFLNVYAIILGVKEKYENWWLTGAV